MPKSRTPRIAVLSLSGALLLSACGTTTVSQQSETSLARKGLAATNAGPAKSINCPSGIPEKVGTTLDCHIKLVSGGSVTFTEKIDRVTSSGGHMTIVGAKQP
jgi:Domain of unknown function (DUF4333)